MSIVACQQAGTCSSSHAPAGVKHTGTHTHTLSAVQVNHFTSDKQWFKAMFGCCKSVLNNLSWTQSGSQMWIKLRAQWDISMQSSSSLLSKGYSTGGIYSLSVLMWPWCSIATCMWKGLLISSQNHETTDHIVRSKIFSPYLPDISCWSRGWCKNPLEVSLLLFW